MNPIPGHTVFLSFLGSTIHRLHNERGMTQDVLSALCDMEKSSISRIENRQTNITIVTLKRFAKAFNVGVIDILKCTEKEKLLK